MTNVYTAAATIQCAQDAANPGVISVIRGSSDPSSSFDMSKSSNTEKEMATTTNKQSKSSTKPSFCSIGGQVALLTEDAKSGHSRLLEVLKTQAELSKKYEKVYKEELKSRNKFLKKFATSMSTFVENKAKRQDNDLCQAEIDVKDLTM